jgi:hypothetical protein
VELARRYTNRLDLADELGRASAQLAEPHIAAGQEPPYEASMAPRGRQQAVRSALDENHVQVILARFAAGVPKHRLAAEYGMSLSTMKRLLRAERRRVVPDS